MSLQLIVYPQSYEGQINSTSSTTTPNELIVDGVNFASVNGVTPSNVDMAGVPGDLNTYLKWECAAYNSRKLVYRKRY